jgi:hypothetical protein
VRRYDKVVERRREILDERERFDEQNKANCERKARKLKGSTQQL